MRFSNPNIYSIIFIAYAFGSPGIRRLLNLKVVLAVSQNSGKYMKLRI